MQDFSEQNPMVVDNKKYRFYCQLKDMYQRPVFVYQSKEASPCNWRICFGWTSLHFRTYREAMDYCKRRGFTAPNDEPLP